MVYQGERAHPGSFAFLDVRGCFSRRGIWVGTWSEKWSVWQESDPQNDTIFSRLYPGIYISGACASSEPCHEFYIKSRSGESLGAERRRKVMPKK